MKYKVGDAVKIRSDIEIDKCYDNFLFTEEMSKYKYQILYISEVLGGFYHIVEDLESFYWTDEMLELGSKYKVGDTVKVRSDLKLNETYQDVTFMLGMQSSDPLKITEISDHKSRFIYKCSNRFWYSEIMLELYHSKYKVGDLIQIRSDLKAREYYGGLCTIDEMIPYKSTFHYIKSIDIDGHYRLEGCPCLWSDEMFVETYESDLKVASVSLASHPDYRDNCTCGDYLTTDCYKPITSSKPAKLNTYTEIKLSKPKTKKYKFYEEN